MLPTTRSSDHGGKPLGWLGFGAPELAQRYTDFAELHHTDYSDPGKNFLADIRTLLYLGSASRRQTGLAETSWKDETLEAAFRIGCIAAARSNYGSRGHPHLNIPDSGETSVPFGN